MRRALVAAVALVGCAVAACGPREESVVAPTASIHGVVLDDRGLPAEGATVTAYPAEERLPVALDDSDDRPLLSGPDGAFAIRGLVPGPYQIGAATEDAATGALLIRAPAEGVCLRLVPDRLDPTRAGAVRFRLRVPSGRPVPSTVEYDAGSFHWRDGEFEMKYLPPGPGCRRLYAPGYAALTLEYAVRSGLTTDLGSFLLDEGVALRGRVVDRSGNAISGAVVTLVLLHSVHDPEVSTDADGRFEMPHGERGDNRIRVERHGFVGDEFTVFGGTANADTFVLRRGGLARVRVVDAAGRSVQSLDLCFSDAAGRNVWGDPIRTVCDDLGICEVRFAAGNYRVRIDDRTSEWTDFVLTEDGTTDVTLTATNDASAPPK